MKIKVRHSYFILLLLCAQFALAQSSQQRPNVIIIMADDLGYSDIGCYGGEVETPNLDKLAANGLRFSQFYNTSRCCPTRASLLTGLYNHRAGIGNMSFDQHTPGYRGYLTENTITLAELLKTAGYNTGMVGKWHVANTRELPDKKEHIKWLNHQVYHDTFAALKQYPVNRGFDKFYGTIWGVVNFFDPFSLVNGDKPVKDVPEDYYYTDALNDSACSYITDFSQKQQPFFLYVAHTAPHWPLHALAEDIKKYEKVYEGGWDAMREKRFEKIKEIGLFSKNETQLPERFGSGTKWNGNTTQNWDAHAMAVRAAMVDRMDQGIGRIIKTLEKNRQLENTLIFFLSDNGASSDNAQNYGPGLDRPGQTRDGQNIIYPVNKKVLPGPENTFASTNNYWSAVANTPFRYWKTESFEGGICTPLIAHWPAGLKTKKGSITSQAGHVMDFMATVQELSGATYPEFSNGNKITPTQGLSLVPILKGEQRKGHEYIFFEHLNGRAVRQGDWKLVQLGPNAPWELYNLATDRFERVDLSIKNPEKVEALKARWMQWAKENHVLPKPAPKSGSDKESS